jgi:hypothetical protein
LQALLGASVLLAGCMTAPSATPPASPASPAAPATDAPTPAPTADLAALEGWLPMTGQGSLSGLVPTDVVWTGSRFVALAHGGDEDVILASTDGRAWSRVFALGADGRIASIAVGNGRVVAMGSVGDWPASWSSKDGLSWRNSWVVLPVGRPTTGGSVAATDATSSGTRFVAVGREDPPCQFDCGVEPTRALGWTSRDGRNWTVWPEQPGLEPGGMNAIARTEAGFVAGGVDGRRPALWSSPDGSSWSRAAVAPIPDPDADPSFSASIVALATDDGTIVCIATSIGLGPGGAPVVLAWWSADGLAWQSAAIPDATPVIAEGVAHTPTGFVATGRAWSGAAGRYVVAAWTSHDGQDWSSAAAPDGLVDFAPTVIASSPTIDVAVGLTEAGASSPSTTLRWRPA